VKSCAHWLNWKGGIGFAAAITHGRVSYFKAGELTRVADATNEDYLLNIALCGTASHVETLVRGCRRALAADSEKRSGRNVF